MTDPRQESNPQRAGISGTAATVGWTKNEAGDDQSDNANPRGATEVVGSSTAAMDQIDQLIGRIHSPASLAVTTPLATPADAAVRKSGPHEDVALKAYMDQFLERARGQTEHEPEGTPTPAAATVPFVRRSEIERPRETRPVPESMQEATQMCVVANEKARQAFGAHDGQRLAGGIRKVFVAALTLSLISSLLAASSLLGRPAWTWYSSLLVLLLAGVLTWRFVRLRGQLQRLNRA